MVEGKTPTEEEKAAYHEAGHAVVAFCMRVQKEGGGLIRYAVPIRYVTIRPRIKGHSGHTARAERLLRYLNFECVTLWAGGVVESIIDPKYNPLKSGADDDSEQIDKLELSKE